VETAGSRRGRLWDEDCLVGPAQVCYVELADDEFCSMEARREARRPRRPGGSEMKFATNSDDGVRIAYELVGEGAPLLLFHGSLTSSGLWRALGYVDALRAEHQLILVDARGHGRSDKPTTTDSYAMERLVGDVIAVLDDCGVPEAAYLGYSLGGRVGFALAIRAAVRVRALIVGGASHRPQNGALDRLIYPGFVDTIEVEGIESCLEQWSARLGRAVDPTVRAVFLANDPSALVPYLRQTDREPGFDDELVSRIQLPVLLFAGECDRERLADSQAAAAVLRNAEFFVLAGRDHESTLRQVVDIASRVRAFLDRTK
jgi:pimeloyl-ACP methyl ester carboxylesterase